MRCSTMCPFQKVETTSMEYGSTKHLIQNSDYDASV